MHESPLVKNALIFFDTRSRWRSVDGAAARSGGRRQDARERLRRQDEDAIDLPARRDLERGTILDAELCPEANPDWPDRWRGTTDCILLRSLLSRWDWRRRQRDRALEVGAVAVLIGTVGDRRAKGDAQPVLLREPGNVEQLLRLARAGWLGVLQRFLLRFREGGIDRLLLIL